MPGGFFDRALKGSSNDSNPGAAPDPSHKSWLSVLSNQPRRPSVGFSNNLSGEAAPMDEDSNGSDDTSGYKSGIVIPKTFFSYETSDTPSPGEDSVFGMGNMAIKAAVDNNSPGAYLKVTEQGVVQLDHVASSEIAQFEARSSQIVRPNGLSDIVTTAISIGDFPVATKESLAQLEEMKQRLQANKEDESLFSMEVEKDEEQIGRSIVRSQSKNDDLADKAEKPPSKLLSYVMKKSFAQNWFFKNNGDAGEDEKSTMDVDLENRDDGAAYRPRAFSEKLLQAEASKKKRQMRETNFMAPQNL